MTNTATHHHSHSPHPAIDPISIDSRQSVMIKAGTHPMIAERLARDAAANQTLRERHVKLSPTQVEAPLVVTAVVPEIIPTDTASGDATAPNLHA